MIKMERHNTGDLRRSARTTRNFFERSRLAQYFLRVVGVFGVALVMSDGVLTPAQSVLGAIQGINVVAPNIGKPTIVGVSCAILVLLFLVQPFGTTKLASSFAPIVIIWLMFNLIFGIYVSNATFQTRTCLCVSSARFGSLPFSPDRASIRPGKLAFANVV